MSVKEKLASLAIPEIKDIKNVLGNIGKGTSEQKVKIEGVLVGKTSDSIILKTQNAFYEIAIVALLELEKDDSEPSA